GNPSPTWHRKVSDPWAVARKLARPVSASWAARRAIAMSTRVIVRASFHCCARTTAGTQAARTPPATTDALAAARNRGRMDGRSSHARDGDTGTLVPVWKEILLDTDTPVSAFARLRHEAGAMRNAEFAFL